MNPIFFPSTWIPESIRGLLFACFQQVTVLQPARELVPEPFRRLEEKDRLNICLPCEEADGETIEDLPNLLGEYHRWADLHQGERPDLHKFARLYAAGRDDTSTAWIRSKIRNPESENTDEGFPDRNAANPLLISKLFLAVAQEYDQQDESLSRDLNTIDNMEQALLRDLSPDQSSPAKISSAAHSLDRVVTGYLMPAQRLAAWRRLYAHCRQRETLPMPASPHLFITGDQETLQLVLGTVDTPEAVCRIVGIPFAGEDDPFMGTAVHQEIDEVLGGAVQGSRLSSASTISFSENMPQPENSGTLTLYRIKGNPILGEFPGPERVLKTSSESPADEEIPFSLLGYIENCTLDSPK